MTTEIFVNLPVQDLARSREFFGKLGFTFNPQFSNDSGACMIVASDICVMLLTRDFFKNFTRNPIADAKKTTEVLTCLSFDSKAKVNELVETALEAGAAEAREPQDHGFMFGRSFHDLDGHIWEIVWMAPNAHP